MPSWCGVVWLFNIFLGKIFVQGIIGKYIFQYSWFPFHFADVFFSHPEAFKFEVIPFVYSFLYIPCSRGTYRWKYCCMEYLKFSCLCSPLGLLWCHNLYISLLSIVKKIFLWCGLVDWALACKPKGHWFDPQSDHKPRLQARSPIGSAWEATTHWCFSLSLSPSLPLCQINK